MNKNWLVLLSLTFGIGFFISLPVTRNFEKSIIVGLASVPGGFVSSLVLDSQYKQRIADLSQLPPKIRALEELEDYQRQIETEVLDLNQARERLTKEIENLTTTENELSELVLLRSQEQQDLDSQVGTLRQKHQRIYQELSDLERDRSELTDTVDSLKGELRELSVAKEQLDNLLVSRSEQQQILDAHITKLQTRIESDNYRKNTLTREIAALEHYLGGIETEVLALNQAREKLTEEIENLTITENELSGLVLKRSQEKQDLDSQLGTLRQEHQRIYQELSDLERDRSELTDTVDSLRTELRDLDADRERLNELLVSRSGQQQILEANIEQLQTRIESDTGTIEELRSQQRLIEEEISILTKERERLIAELSEWRGETLEELQAPSNESSYSSDTCLEAPVVTPNILEENVSLVEPSPTPREIQRQAFDPYVSNQFRLANTEHTEWLWEEVLFPRMQYRTFLGSICLPRTDSEEVWGTETVLNIVGENLRRMGENNLDYDSICRRFGDDNDRNWLKIITFAMSEYAYYDDSENGFWQGLCKRLGLPYRGDNCIPVSTLKTLAEEGIELLGLPRAEGGYRIVSTLWLQSGIPYENLHHFSDLVAGLVDESSWNEIQNSDVNTLSRELLDVCQSRYQGRRVLQRFLEYSCQPNAQPVSGMLLQGIARVAIVLRNFNQRSEILLNPAQRQEFLVNSVPEFQLFLRDWSAVVEILQSDRPDRQRRRQRSVRPKPLTLQFNLDTYEIELVLPEQTLSNEGWMTGVCSIPQIKWQGEINSDGRVTIPKYTYIVHAIAEEWQWQLLDSRQCEICNWDLEGTSLEFPCLIFDAVTGDRLLPNPSLINIRDIFCFVPVRTGIAHDTSIGELENGIPCSIPAWQGSRLQLLNQSAQLSFQFADHEPISLEWRIVLTPELRGLLSASNRNSYLECPTLWYPPHAETLSLVLTIEELGSNDNNSICVQDISLPSSDSWYPISLERWISPPGEFRVRLDTPNWSQRFQIEPLFEVGVEHIHTLPSIEVTDRQGNRIDLPLTVTESSQFWALTVSIRGLWTLEPLKLFLSNGIEEISQSRNADRNGELTLELSTFHDILPQTEQYFLDYQSNGQIRQLLTRLIPPLSWRWVDGNLHLNGLSERNNYTLSGWNFLRPQHPYYEIQVPLGTSAVITFEGVPLGIYHWQLRIPDQDSRGIGWWCGCDDPYDFEIEEDDFTDFCYSILDHELLGNFQRIAGSLSWDRDLITRVIHDLTNGNNWFPEWLSADALCAKLHSLLEPYSGKWYRIFTTEGMRGDFHNTLYDVIDNENLWTKILEIRRHPDTSNPDELLVNLALVSPMEVRSIRDILERLDDFHSMSRNPLSDEEVTTLINRHEI